MLAARAFKVRRSDLKMDANRERTAVDAGGEEGWFWGGVDGGGCETCM